MRIMFVVLAGIVGWLWFATREASSQVPPPAAPARRAADLSGLHAQLAATQHARSAAIEIEIPDETPSIDPDDPNILADEQRDADVSGLRAQIEARQQLADEIADADTLDEALLDDTIGHEVIQIVGSAPIIDPTPVTHDYTYNIPTGRTFEGVLGAAAGEQSQDYGVSISSNCGVENVYIVDETVVVDDEPAPIVEDHVIED